MRLAYNTDVTLSFTVPGKPKGKASVRVFRGGGRKMPAAEYESHVAYFAGEALNGQRWWDHEANCALTISAVLPRPKRLMRKKDPDGLIYAPTRPDLSNIVKAVEDGCMKAGVFVDDSQVVRIVAEKFYSERGGLPRVEVIVRQEGSPGRAGLSSPVE